MTKTLAAGVAQMVEGVDTGGHAATFVLYTGGAVDEWYANVRTTGRVGVAKLVEGVDSGGQAATFVLYNGGAVDEGDGNGKRAVAGGSGQMGGRRECGRV